MTEKRKFTFLLIPHKAGSAKEFSIGYGSLFLFFLLIFSLCAILASTIYFSSKLTKLTVQYVQQEKRNKGVLEELKAFRGETENLKTILLSLKERDDEVRKMLGLMPNTNDFIKIGLKKK